MNVTVISIYWKQHSGVPNRFVSCSFSFIFYAVLSIISDRTHIQQGNVFIFVVYCYSINEKLFTKEHIVLSFVEEA